MCAQPFLRLLVHVHTCSMCSNHIRMNTCPHRQQSHFTAIHGKNKTIQFRLSNLLRWQSTPSATNALLDPERHDMVATLAEVTGSIALQSMCNQMMSDPTTVHRILNDRPLVNTKSIDISKLANLPSNTFGYHYAKFLQTHKFNPNHRAAVCVACKYGFSINDLVTLIQLLIHTEANLRETDYTVLSKFLCRY